MKIALKQNHPTLFMSLMIKAGFMVLVGLVLVIFGVQYFIEPHALQQTLIPVNLWGIPVAVAGIMVFYGILGCPENYKWARRGLLTGSVVAGIFAAAYFFAFLSGYSDRIMSGLFWGYLSMVLAIWVPEPTFNPIASATLNKKDK